MRNLDWEANTGMNANKIIFVWKVKDTIPHTTIGFPGITGALAGMSQAGLSVHEAGLGSMKETELGFQWTLRLRYILMKAKNVAEAKAIWLETKNTFGMNHMVASASDVKSGSAPIMVMETMRATPTTSKTMSKMMATMTGRLRSYDMICCDGGFCCHVIVLALANRWAQVRRAHHTRT